MPKKTRRRKPKGPQVPNRLVDFLMEHDGMTRREAVRAAVRGERVVKTHQGPLMTRFYCDGCDSSVGDPYDALDDAQLDAARQVARDHIAHCPGRAA
jgi:hypothetical protein